MASSNVAVLASKPLEAVLSGKWKRRGADLYCNGADPVYGLPLYITELKPKPHV
jgi:hypothetical protein